MNDNPKTESAEGAETVRSLNHVTSAIIGAAIEVHRHLGPGLLESAYEECLCYELSHAGLSFCRQVAIPVQYKGLKLNCDFRVDLIVEDSVIVEIKAIDHLAPIHSAQLLTYLKATNKTLGLLINFNVPVLKQGIKRLVNRYITEPGASASAPSAAEPRERDTHPSPHSSLRLSPSLGASAVNRRPH